MARDRVRLRRTLARNLARQARRETPSRTTSPTPSRPPSPTPQPAATPPSRTRVPALQQRVDVLHAQIMSELTPAQRSRAGKIPTPKVVESIGRVGEREVAGRAIVPPQGRVAGLIFRGVQAVKGQPVRSTRIALSTSNPEAALRHETAHQVLGTQGIPVQEHHPIIRRARTPGTTSGVNFRLLQTAMEAHRAPTEEQRRRLSRQRLKLGAAERRRSNR